LRSRRNVAFWLPTEDKDGGRLQMKPSTRRADSGAAFGGVHTDQWPRLWQYSELHLVTSRSVRYSTVEPFSGRRTKPSPLRRRMTHDLMLALCHSDNTVVGAAGGYWILRFPEAHRSGHLLIFRGSEWSSTLLGHNTT